VPGGIGRILLAVLTSDIRRGRAVIMPSSSTICNKFSISFANVEKIINTHKFEYTYGWQLLNLRK